MQITRKFYKITYWDEELYHRLSQQYNFHVDLVEDLMLELTRSANYTCDMIRRHLLPQFRQETGVLLIEAGIDMNMQTPTYRAEYQESERSLEPYPGLKRFLRERANRDLHFGVGINWRDPEFIEYEQKHFAAWLEQYQEGLD